MIRIGTCGFSYADWKGPFYPPAIRPSEMLPFYASRFPVVELDATYYRVPPESTFASMARRTPEGFRFTAKLPGSGTHAPVAAMGSVHADVTLFRRNLKPLVDSGKLVCALMQFPNAFRPSDHTRAHIAALREVLHDIELVAEFRHRDWQTPETLAFLRSLGVGWVNVDMPSYDTLLRPSADVTSGIAYIRLHGRNAKTWWKGDNVSRYDYEYSAAELHPWAERALELALTDEVREALVLFNNHRRGQAPRNAEMFEEMVRARFPAALVATNAGPTAEQLALDV